MSNAKTCPQCGTTFEGRSNKIYCSDSCKMQSFRQEKAISIIPMALPRISPTNASVPRASRNGAIDKTTVELEKLRLQTSERLKQMEYDELERKRKFEIEQAKQQFTFELDREGWKLENEPLAPPSFDQTPILSRLDDLDRKLNQPAEPISETTEPKEKEGSDLLVMGGLGLLGFLLLKSMLAPGVPQPTRLSSNQRNTVKSLDEISKEYLQQYQESMVSGTKYP